MSDISDMVIKNDKYVVLRRHDYEGLLEVAGFDEDGVETVPDAIVIRRQDRFAANALDTYADQILALTELCEDSALEVMSPETIENLEKLSDFFREQAHLSRQEVRKLPD